MKQMFENLLTRSFSLNSSCSCTKSFGKAHVTVLQTRDFWGDGAVPKAQQLSAWDCRELPEGDAAVNYFAMRLDSMALSQRLMPKLTAMPSTPSTTIMAMVLI